MRWNENEVMRLSQQTPDWEGKLHYLPPDKSSQPSIIKSGARSAAKLGNELVKSFAGGVSGNAQSPSALRKLDSTPHGNARERWFRLKANLLFYFKLTPEGRKPPLPGTEPLGLFVLEHFHIQREGFEKKDTDALVQNQFSLIFADEPNKRHFFTAESQPRALQWETALKQASHQRLRERLVDLQIKIRTRTGKDPLEGSSFQHNRLFSDINAFSNLTLACTPAPIKGEGPSPPPRPKKQKAKSQTFQSHIVNDWESFSPIVIANEATEESFVQPINDRAASFRSHISDAPIDNLIQF